MLIAIVVLLTVAFWGGMLLLYYKSELGQWLDNRFGPDHISEEELHARRLRKEKRAGWLRWYK
ncbi:MAG: hypothetical protein INR65_04305 [Gluconacetobacter diazotrophicus]|nr:hypothetical protein [Gluconacetobacter diazotrophicus]